MKDKTTKRTMPTVREYEYILQVNNPQFLLMDKVEKLRQEIRELRQELDARKNRH